MKVSEKVWATSEFIEQQQQQQWKTYEHAFQISQPLRHDKGLSHLLSILNLQRMRMWHSCLELRRAHSLKIEKFLSSPRVKNGCEEWFRLCSFHCKTSPFHLRFRFHPCLPLGRVTTLWFSLAAENLILHSPFSLFLGEDLLLILFSPKLLNLHFSPNLLNLQRSLILGGVTNPYSYSAIFKSVDTRVGIWEL